MSAGIIGGVVGGLVVLVIGLLLPTQQCPNCARALPRFRIPQNFRQMIWGGTTCPNCGCETDRRGRRISS